MKAIILSAGQGRRLLPLTRRRPKCLINLSGISILEWQLFALREAGVEEVVVVTGFAAEEVEKAVHQADIRSMRVRLLHNPFYAVSDNLASCWVARHEMTGEFFIINGDTLSEPTIAKRLLANDKAPIVVTIDRKSNYDADDMKVSVEGDRLRAIGKTLNPSIVNGESIGFLRFNARGAELFLDEIDRAMKSEQGLKQWYLSAIDTIAKASGEVGTLSVEGLEWCEIDFPADLRKGEAMTRGWLAGYDGNEKLVRESHS